MESEINELNERAEALLRSNPREAQVLARQALAVAERDGIGSTTPLSRFLDGIAESYLGDFRRSMLALESAAADAKAKGQLALENRCFNGLATCYTTIGQYGKAFEMLHNCLMLARKSDDLKGQIRALANLGTVYTNVQDFAKASESFEESLRLAEQISDSSLLAVVSAANLAESLSMRGAHAESLALNEKWSGIAVRDDHVLQHAYLRSARGQTLLAMGDFDGAVSALREAERVGRELGERDLLGDVLLKLARVEAERGDAEAARQMAEEALTLSTEMGIKQYQQRAHRILSEVSEKKGDFRAAFFHRSRELEFETELGMERTNRKTQILDVEFAVEQFRREAEAQRDRNAELNALNQRLRTALDQLEYQASHDGLTGLLNRRKFLELAHASVVEARSRVAQVGLCFIDLNGFKAVNDRFGHDVGDFLLAEVGRRLKTAVRGCDYVARVGGDEFTVLLRDLPSAETIRAAAEKLRRVFENPFPLRGTPYPMYASIGLSIFPHDGNSVETLQQRADQAMYRDKRTVQTAGAPDSV